MLFKKYFLLITLLPLIILAASSTIYRFYIKADYMVEYQVECDPVIENCFIGCEDDACSITYPYFLMHKNAAAVKASCGLDITDCDEAYACDPEEENCEMIFCSPETEECFVASSSEDKADSGLVELIESDI